jgi:hypothetical protein
MDGCQTHDVREQRRALVEVRRAAQSTLPRAIRAAAHLGEGDALGSDERSCHEPTLRVRSSSPSYGEEAQGSVHFGFEPPRTRMLDAGGAVRQPGDTQARAAQALWASSLLGVLQARTAAVCSTR